MAGYENTSLWQSTLGPRPGDEHEAARSRLRAALRSLRDERAALAAQEIGRRLPDFTIHDVTHSDALWELAELIAGPDLELTPTEGFVLGAAFLIHDLGMGLVAISTDDDVRRDVRYRDLVVTRLMSEGEESPAVVDFDAVDAETDRYALSQLLRDLHAERAERLALSSWNDGHGGRIHLIEDREVREAFGRVIGVIAHSHGIDVGRLTSELPRASGAPHWCPGDWRVDPLKLAALLRVADAAHLDPRRAPAMLRALRQPHGEAAAHWSFQEKLVRPILEGDRLTFSSARPFDDRDARAWWLAFDTLQLVDRELREVDALLADTGRRRFLARGVSGADDPARLTPYVETEGWTPVDARVHVTDVAHLVRHFGGEELYGNDGRVPLRELIQNAADAVRARRVLEERSPDWGSITVRWSEEHAEEPWIEVEDTGLGMSASVLTRWLLDFGASYWRSGELPYDLPGLLSRGFEPTGRFGIGFFSVFMWGSRVRVTTRRFDEAVRDTRVLRFDHGVAQRPIVAEAGAGDELRDGGTRVRVYFEASQEAGAEPGGARESEQEDEEEGEGEAVDPLEAIARSCAEIAPALDVDLWVEIGNRRARVLQGGDWLTMTGDELLRRTADRFAASEVETPAPQPGELRDATGRVVGRAFLSGTGSDGVAVVGGLRACEIQGIGGILVASPLRASRDIALPVVDPPELARWATEQASLATTASETEQLRLAAAAIACGGDPGELRIAERGGALVRYSDLAGWEDPPEEVLLVYSVAVANLRFGGPEVALRPEVISVDWTPSVHLSSSRSGPHVQWPPTGPELLLIGPWNTPARVVVQAMAAAWGVGYGELMRHHEAREGRTPGQGSIYREREIGLRDGEPVKAWTSSLRSPRA